MDMIGGVQWRTRDDDQKADGERMGGGVIVAESGVAMKEYESEIMREVFKDAVPRAFRITRGDFETHGYTRDCPGCKAILKGTTLQKHSAACRNRMEKEMGDQEKVKSAKKRREDFVTRAMDVEAMNKDLEKKRERDMNEDAMPQEKRKKESEASGSGMTEEERKEQLKRKKE